VLEFKSAGIYQLKATRRLHNINCLIAVICLKFRPLQGGDNIGYSGLGGFRVIKSSVPCSTISLELKVLKSEQETRILPIA
jgi:hypothetical protein